MTLSENPFHRLGVSPRSPKADVVSRAEAVALTADARQAQEMRNQILSPTRRLAAELAWLPGIAPRRASEFVARVDSEPEDIVEIEGLPELCRFNLIRAAIERCGGQIDDDTLRSACIDLADCAEELDAEEIQSLVNEDRAVAGVAPVTDLGRVESGLRELQREAVSTLMAVLSSRDLRSCAQLLASIVTEATNDGEWDSPMLLDEVVDAYRMSRQDALERWEEEVEAQASELQRLAAEGASKSLLQETVARLTSSLERWDELAQPIQVSYRARGLDEQHSERIGHIVRSTAVEICNEHALIDEAEALTEILRSTHAEVPRLAEMLERDGEAISSLRNQKNRAESAKRDWEKEITWSTELGMLFKDKLSISPEGLSWNSRSIPLDDIHLVRWGAIRHSTNGIPTGTDHHVGASGGKNELRISFRSGPAYEALVPRLWKAVGVRLIGELLEAVANGDTVTIGGVRVSDHGLQWTVPKLFKQDLDIRVSWSEIQILSVAGSFRIQEKREKGTYVDLSYIDVWNTHILEAAIRAKFKRPGRSLSDLLE